MSKVPILIIVAAVALFIVSVATESRIAAGGGALLLFVAIIYGFVRNKGGSRREVARAEVGARHVRDEIAEDEERRGER